jgi:hypothetical protein
MTRNRTTRTAAKSRRRFLKTVALGSVAAVVGAALPRGGDAAPSKARPRHSPAAPSRPPALEAEIAKQKKATADLLKTIRDFELPAGSEMAFVFSALKPDRRRAAAGNSRASGGSR